MNIIDYVKTEMRTFEEEPFNSVDSLVLAQLSYVKFEVILEKEQHGWAAPSLHLKDLYKLEYFGQMFCDGITDEQNREFFVAAAGNPRFRNLRVRNLVSEIDEGSHKQFAVMVFELDGKTDYIAFRGTDGTMLGWREDFNLSFMDEVPSQADAVKYIETHYGDRNLYGRKKHLIIGGHSKGGNLAVYAALMCDPKIHSRIRGIYSLDGPGFRDEVLENLNEIRERDGLKITKIVPQSSVIGMLLQSTEEYQVVKSDALGLMQHSAYTWQLEGGDFQYLEEMAFGGEYADRTIHNWLMTVEDERRETFVNTLFDVLDQNGIVTVHDLKKLSIADYGNLVGSIRDLDEETRRLIWDVLTKLAGSAVTSLSTWDAKHPEWEKFDPKAWWAERGDSKKEGDKEQ